MTSPSSLAGQAAVITGAGSGVGRASALAFAAAGARVVCADVRDDWAKETARLVAAAGGTAVVQHCDVAVEEDVAAAVAAAVEHFGRLDVMFNNAGVTGFKPGASFEDFTADDFARLTDINFRGVFNGCKHAVKQFKQQGRDGDRGGVIVNTGSVAGIVGFGSVVYGATKGAVNQITRGVAVECAPFGIRCNAICPGAMPLTNFTPASPGAEFQPPEQQYLDEVAAYQPLGRYITAEDCAQAALFLASDASRNITGVLLPVDGGYIAR
ncbi:oxidoreductase [Frankia sp. CcI49]|uniref:SDR family NAD(P)-dependent oxidoreductase n=1 Tax=Frankia sp. CcI49 TaxID=1745382 RepID=UPI00097817F0|nr:glucose 1-dehydrogenase [Frankia sp. CcI49]ONH58857.1 oxidoreductase [Frankia sp. CcI49]